MPSDATSRAPATTSSGARSPPRASTATRIMRRTLRRVYAQRLDVPALVRVTGRADAVRPLRLAAGRADVDAGGGAPVLRPSLVAAGLRRLSLRDGHGRASLADRSPASAAPKPR